MSIIGIILILRWGILALSSFSRNCSSHRRDELEQAGPRSLQGRPLRQMPEKPWPNFITNLTMPNAWKVALKLIFMWILSLKAYFSKAWVQPELTVKARWSPKPKKSSSSVVCSGRCTQITKIRHHEFVAEQVFKWGANLIRPSKILRKNSFIKEPEFFLLSVKNVSTFSNFWKKCFGSEKNSWPGKTNSTKLVNFEAEFLQL